MVCVEKHQKFLIFMFFFWTFSREKHQKGCNGESYCACLSFKIRLYKLGEELHHDGLILNRSFKLDLTKNIEGHSDKVEKLDLKA